MGFPFAVSAGAVGTLQLPMSGGVSVLDQALHATHSVRDNCACGFLCPSKPLIGGRCPGVSRTEQFPRTQNI